MLHHGLISLLAVQYMCNAIEYRRRCCDWMSFNYFRLRSHCSEDAVGSHRDDPVRNCGNPSHSAHYHKLGRVHGFCLPLLLQKYLLRSLLPPLQTSAPAHNLGRCEWRRDGRLIHATSHPQQRQPSSQETVVEWEFASSDDHQWNQPRQRADTRQSAANRWIHRSRRTPFHILGERLGFFYRLLFHVHNFDHNWVRWLRSWRECQLVELTGEARVVRPLLDRGVVTDCHVFRLDAGGSEEHVQGSRAQDGNPERWGERSTEE